MAEFPLGASPCPILLPGTISQFRDAQICLDHANAPRNLSRQSLPDLQADPRDLHRLNRAENNLARGFWPSRKEHMPHQAANLFLGKAIGIPKRAFRNDKWLGLCRPGLEDVVTQPLVQRIR